MRTYYHSDDIGATSSITKRILQAWKEGLLDGFSIMANGEALSDISAGLLQNADKEARISVHLNLSEGKSLFPPEKLSLLVDSNGNLKHGFISLLTLWLKSSSRVRKQMLMQIENEFRAQIRRAKEVCTPRHIRAVDGHNHIHMLPFAFPIAARLAKEEGIPEIRISRELFFLSPQIRESLKIGFLVNILKHVVLRVFSWKAIPVAKRYGLSSPDALLGVLYTGMMSENAARAGINSAKRNGIERLEILFHIGRASKDELGRWITDPRVASFFASESRDLEFIALKRLRKGNSSVSN